MKAEINNENKAKFFAQYWGQEIARGGNADFLIQADPRMPEWYHSNYYLELKPLSSISDVDAIDLYNILYHDTKWADSYKIKEAKSWLKDEFEIGRIGNKWDCMFVADFLRSRGYLVPWMGLSCEEIIEAGWAKYV